MKKKTKNQKLARLDHIATDDDRFFHDYRSEIEEYLRDEDPEVRAAAVECLWDYPDLVYIDLLTNLAENDPSDQVRQRALSALGIYIWEGEMAKYDLEWGPYDDLMQEEQLPEKDLELVRNYLLGVIRDEDRPLDEQRYAIEAISFRYDPDVLDIIEEAYQHPDDRMKASAIFAMGRNGNVRWADDILEALHSPVPEIQYEAVRAAGECQVEEANRRLMHLAEHAEDKEVRMEAIWSLGQIGHRDSFLLLDDLQFDPDEDIRRAAEFAMEEWLMLTELSEYDDEDFSGFEGNGRIWLN